MSYIQMKWKYERSNYLLESARGSEIIIVESSEERV